MNIKNKSNKFNTYTLIATERRFVSDMLQVARMLTKSLGHLCHVIPPSVFLAKGNHEPVSTIVKGSDMTIVFTTTTHNDNVAGIVKLVRSEFATYITRVVREGYSSRNFVSTEVDETIRRNEIFLYGKLARWRVIDRFCNLARYQ